ncbi:MAG: hypothetical protein ACI32E_02030 [Bacilli bacterium]
MKNKLLIVLFITLFLSFTSCAKPNNNSNLQTQEHVHNFCITESDDEYHWLKCSYEGCNEISEKGEHDLSVTECDDEYHWKKCNFDGCNKIGEKSKHYFDYSKRTIIDGNVNTYSYMRIICDECGCISDTKCANEYRFDASINNWFRYRVVDVVTDYVLVNSSSHLLYSWIDSTPEALIEASKTYAVLKLEVLETYNKYVVNAKSDDNYKYLDSYKYAFMLVPMQLLDYYTRCEEYIAPLTQLTTSLAYEQRFVDYLVENLGYEDDSGYIQFKRQKYSTGFFDNYNVFVPYYQYNFRYGNLEELFKYANTINVLPIVNGRIDYSLYSEEEKELFFNIDDKHSPKDTIYRYLNVYVDEEHKFTFDYTLEELRVWLQEYSQYLYEAEQKFIEEDGKLFILPGCGKPGYY